MTLSALRPALLALALFAPLAAPAAAQTQAEIDRFLAVLAQLDCKITGTNGPTIEASTGFSAQLLGQIFTALAQQGALTRTSDNATIFVNAGPCAR